MKNLSSECVVVLENNILFLKGAILKETVMGAWEESKQKVLGQFPKVIDLGGVTHCDSASLALLLELLRLAQQKKEAITFANMPKQMVDIAHVNGLITLLPLSEA